MIRKTTGIVLIAVALCVFLTEAWYLNFEMEAWARGMEPTPIYQRLLATTAVGILSGLITVLGWRLFKRKNLTNAEKIERLKERYPSPFERVSTKLMRPGKSGHEILAK